MLGLIATLSWHIYIYIYKNNNYFLKLEKNSPILDVNLDLFFYIYLVIIEPYETSTRPLELLFDLKQLYLHFYSRASLKYI